jgi:hypothetical protein
MTCWPLLPLGTVFDLADATLTSDALFPFSVAPLQTPRGERSACFGVMEACAL